MPGRLSEQIQILNKGIRQREEIIEDQEEKIRDLRQLAANQGAEITELRRRITAACESIDDVIGILESYRDVTKICMENLGKIQDKINKGE